MLTPPLPLIPSHWPRAPPHHKHTATARPQLLLLRCLAVAAASLPLLRLAGTMASSCLSTAAAHAALRLLADAAGRAQLQLQLQLHHASSSVFPRPARAHHRLVADHVAAPAAPVHRRRALAFTAMASREEAAATAVEEEEVLEREGEGQIQERDEVREEGGAVEASSDDSGPSVAANTTTTTKLYFGNLPYNCDSAQLAGIVQEYASPEMVEVLAVFAKIRK